MTPLFQMLSKNKMLLAIVLVEFFYAQGKLLFFLTQQNVAEFVFHFRPDRIGLFAACNGAAAIFANLVLVYLFTLCTRYDKTVFMLGGGASAIMMILYGFT
ncbi:unnamed protein product, partial [Amoebophrya sp. A25]|eukprot:GSA25T00008895001.1